MEIILDPLDANFAAQVLNFDDLLVNFTFSIRILMILMDLEQIFKGFSLPRPRFLQYLTVNLKVFAYCSESLRKRFRCLQNAPKMPPSGLPGPLWEPMRGLWSSKLSPKIPKRHLKCPKEVSSDPQKVAKGSPRIPKTSPKIPNGYPRDC